MKILFITNMYPTESQPVSGIFVKEQIESIRRMMPCNCEVVLIDGMHKGKLEYLKSMFLIPRKIRKNSYNIIHIHYGLSALFLLFYKPKIKVFLTLHGSDIFVEGGNKWQVFITKRMLGKVNKVFVLNKKMEKIVRNYNSNTELLPCGVDTDFFVPTDNQGYREHSKLILFPNSPQRVVKNFPLFEAVITRLNQKSEYDIKFACIENLSREGVRELMGGADCLLMTSKSEGSPQVVKEALSCGLPVVSVPVGDVRELVTDVPRCYVSQSTDPKELADLVLRSFQEEGDRQTIRDAFMSKGSYDHYSIAQKLVNNYQNSLNKVLVNS